MILNFVRLGMKPSIRIVKSKDCPRCRAYIKQLDTVGFKYSVYDADAPENQKQLDEWKIDIMPVVQVIKEDGSLLEQLSRGEFSPRFLNARLAYWEKKYDNKPV